MFSHAFPQTLAVQVKLNESIIHPLIFIYLTRAHLQSFCLSLLVQVRALLRPVAAELRVCVMSTRRGGFSDYTLVAANAREPTGLGPGTMHVFDCVKMTALLSASQKQMSDGEADEFSQTPPHFSLLVLFSYFTFIHTAEFRFCTNQ